MEDGRRRRRRRTIEDPIDKSNGDSSKEQMPLYISEEEKAMMLKKAHECPVPKPPGIIGRILGFQDDDSRKEQPRPEVITQKESKARDDDH